MNVIERLAEVAGQCAKIEEGKPFGAYISSKFFAGGFSFAKVEDAAQWVDQQCTRAQRDGHRDDFRAAIADARTGRSVSLYS